MLQLSGQGNGVVEGPGRGCTPPPPRTTTARTRRAPPPPTSSPPRGSRQGLTASFPFQNGCQGESLVPPSTRGSVSPSDKEDKEKDRRFRVYNKEAPGFRPAPRERERHVRVHMKGSGARPGPARERDTSAYVRRHQAFPLPTARPLYQCCRKQARVRATGARVTRYDAISEIDMGDQTSLRYR
jgi:hypothetical protein